MAVFSTNLPTSFNYNAFVTDAGDTVALIANDPSAFGGYTLSDIGAFTTFTSTLASGTTFSGATWTMAGSNLTPFFFAVAGTATIQTIDFLSATDHLLIKGPFSITFNTVEATGASGAITKVQYDSDTFHLNFQGSFPLTQPTTTITKMD